MNAECSILRVLIFSVNFAPGYPRRYTAMDMKRHLSVSLKAAFCIVTVVALLIYGFLPVSVDVTCDPGKCGYQKQLSAGDSVDIQGRDRQGSFITLTRNVKLMSYSEVKNGRSTQFRLGFKSTIHKKQLFKNYDILRVSGKSTEFIEGSVWCKGCRAPTPLE